MKSLKWPLIILLVLTLLTAAFLFYSKTPTINKTNKFTTGNDEETASTSYSIDEIILKAGAALDRGAFEEVIEILSPVADVDNPYIKALYGYAYAGLKRFDKAIQFFEKALELRRDTKFGYALAYLLETAGEYERAKALYADLTRAKLPNQILYKVYEGLARCSIMEGDTKTALDSYSFVMKQAPTRVEPFVGILKIMRQTGDIKKLEEIRNRGDALHSSNFDYNYWLGVLYYELSDYQKALVCFRKCTQINPSNSSPYYYLYKILRRMKQIDEAVKELERFHALNPNLPYIFFQAAIDAKIENRLDTAFKFLRTAVTMDRSLLGRDDKGCIAAVERYIKASGTPEEKLFWPAFYEFINGNYAKAAQLAEKLLVSLKDASLRNDAERIIAESKAVLQREEAYNSYLERIQKARDAAFAALKANIEKASDSASTASETTENPLEALKLKALNNPRDAKLQYATALELARAGDLEGAKLFLKETIKANPNIAEAYYSLGKLLYHEGEKNEALEQLHRAIQINPSDSQSRSIVATIFFENGEFENAEQEARAALLANPNNGEARLILAQTLIQNEKSEEALKEIEFALELEQDPNLRKRFLELKRRLHKTH